MLQHYCNRSSETSSYTPPRKGCGSIGPVARTRYASFLESAKRSVKPVFQSYVPISKRSKPKKVVVKPGHDHPVSVKIRKMKTNQKSKALRNIHANPKLVKSVLKDYEGPTKTDMEKIDHRTKSYQSSNYIPQIHVAPVIVDLDNDSVVRVAFEFVNLAVARGIDVGVVLSDGTTSVGAHYTAALVLVDAIKQAVKGERPLFQRAPRQIWELLAAVKPKDVDGIEYKFRDASPDIDQFLSTVGLIYTRPNSNNSISLSWPVSSTPGSDGVIELNNTVPAVTRTFLEEVGVEYFVDLCIKMSQDNTDDLIDCPDENHMDRSPAAFAQCIGARNDAMGSRADFTCESHYDKRDQWAASLCLSSFNLSRKGVYTNPDYATSYYFLRRFRLNIHGRKKHFMIVPKPMDLTHYFAAYVVMLLAGDVAYASVTNPVNSGNRSNFSQEQASPLLQVTSTDVLIGIFYSMCYKYGVAGSNVGTMSMSSAHVNLTGDITSVCDNSGITTPAIAVINEHIASCYEFECGDKVYVPVPVASNNLSAYGTNIPDLSIIFARLYPHITLASPYSYSPANDPIGTIPFISLQNKSVMWNYGGTVGARLINFGGMLTMYQGNFFVAGLGDNIHPDTTLLHYTKCLGPSVTSSLDNPVRFVTNSVPFSPNMNQYDLSSILPTVVGEESDLIAYRIFTGEYCSLTFLESSTDSFDIMASIIVKCTPHIHARAGTGNEGDMSYESVVQQHMGGGFLERLVSVGKKSLDPLRMIGSNIIDEFIPGASGLMNNNSAVADFTRKLQHHSGSSPYSRVLRPIASGLVTKEEVIAHYMK